MYFVRENGENNAIVQSLDTVKGCLVKGGCAVVPGLPREQWILTLITSIVGGLVFGFAGIPRKEGQVFALQIHCLEGEILSWGDETVTFPLMSVIKPHSAILSLIKGC